MATKKKWKMSKRDRDALLVELRACSREEIEGRYITQHENVKRIVKNFQRLGDARKEVMAALRDKDAKATRRAMKSLTKSIAELIELGF